MAESEKQFKTIYEDAPIRIALNDSITGRIYEVNPMVAKIAGRMIEEMAKIDRRGAKLPFYVRY